MMMRNLIVIIAIVLIGVGLILQNTEIGITTRKDKEKKEVMAGAEPFEHLSGGSSAVLLIHGYTGSPFEMKELAQVLIAQGYDVVCPLLPGHGTSEDDLNQTRFKDWYADIHKIYLDLKSKYNKVYVIGQSMGGTLALKLAEEYSGTEKAPDGIGVLSTPVQFNGWINSRLYFKDWRLSFAGIVGRFIPLLDVPPEHDPFEIVPTISYKKKYSVQALHSFILGMRDVKSKLSKVNEPICIIHARLDKEIGYENSVYIDTVVSSKMKKFYTLEYPANDKTHQHVNITHILVKQKVFRYLVDFLKGLTP